MTSWNKSKYSSVIFTSAVKMVLEKQEIIDELEKQISQYQQTLSEKDQQYSDKIDKLQEEFQDYTSDRMHEQCQYEIQDLKVLIASIFAIVSTAGLTDAE